MNTTTFAKLFSVLAVLHITVAYVNENENLIAISKLLPMAALILYVYHRRGWKDLFLLAALFFSFSGDALLLSSNSNMFMLGMGAFSMAHISYIFHFKRTGERWKPWVAPLILIPIAILFYWYTADSLNGIFSFAIPLYMGLILLMNYMVISRWRKPLRAETLLTIGALSFTASDAILGINKFVEPVLGSDIWVMSTYYIAQFGLVIGSIEHAEYQPGSTS